ESVRTASGSWRLGRCRRACRALPGGAAGRHRGAGRAARGRLGADDRCDDAATTFPLLAMFRRITGARSDAGRLAALVVLGFLAAWLAFGISAHLVDAGVRWGAARSGWFVANGWMIGAAVLAGAGLFQWSALKYRC